MENTLKGKAHYQALFQDFEKSLNGESRSPLHQLRQKAMSQFVEQDFPTKRQEEWRFTDVRQLAESAYAPTNKETVTLQQLDAFLIDNSLPRLVFVNGEWDDSLSNTNGLPAGVSVQNLRETAANASQVAHLASSEVNPFVALNTAFLRQGTFISVKKNTRVENPLHILYVTRTKENALTQPRNFVHVEKNAELSIIESYINLDSDAYFTNSVSEIYVQDNAVVHHYKLEHESKAAYHTSFTQVHQESSSQYHSHNFSFGGKLVRNDIVTTLDGEGADCTLNGLSLIDGRQHVDNHTKIEHAKAHCTSNQLYKGIMDDRSHVVFSGKIHVFKDAQKTDAMQSSQNLLLSNKATVNTKPQLEIYADDVKCTHGSTVGELDENGIFYLRSRGISQENARKLMIQAFAGEVTTQIKNNTVREHVEELVLTHLHSGQLE